MYEQIARVGKAVASPHRLELLDLLSQGARTVESLADAGGMPMANASQHLQVLRAARLVETRKRGLFVEYRLADPGVERFYLALRSLAEARLAELQDIARRFVDERDGLEQVDREQLLRRVRSGEVTVIDVRPAEEYRAAHIPGAISVPLAELKQRLADLPQGREIVAYCRGPYCVMAIEAVEVLRRKGLRARRMEDGVADWRARGWRVEQTSESP